MALENIYFLLKNKILIDERRKYLYDGFITKCGLLQIVENSPKKKEAQTQVILFLYNSQVKYSLSKVILFALYFFFTNIVLFFYLLYFDIYLSH